MGHYEDTGDLLIGAEEDVISEELSLMVDQGLLQMSINDEGEAVYWPTELGFQVLEMS